MKLESGDVQLHPANSFAGILSVRQMSALLCLTGGKRATQHDVPVMLGKLHRLMLQALHTSGTQPFSFSIPQL
jgi:hypothetical protein